MYTEADCLTEEEFQAASAVRARREPHPVCALIRQLRHASGLSLASIEQKHGISSVVLGAYERGDREPPLRKIDSILGIFGYRLEAIPVNASAVRMPGDMVATLRSIADQIEDASDLPELPQPATSAD